MAAICVELHMSPADFWNLKADEYAALVKELNARHKQAKAVHGG